MDLEQQLSAALAPREPGAAPMAAVMARLSAAPKASPRRKASRTILLGTLLAVAAAASMLALQLVNAPASQMVTAQLPSPAPAPVLEELPVPVPAPQPAAPRPAVAASEPARPALAIKPFTVRLLPLDNEGTTGAAQLAIQSFHAAAIESLRATPGLILLLPDSPQSDSDAPPDYRITMRGSGPLDGGNFEMMMRVEVIGRFTLPIKMTGPIASATSACEGPTDGRWCSSASMGAAGVKTMQDMVFPGDPDVPRKIQATLMDQSLGATARLTALRELKLMQTSVPGSARYKGVPEILREPVLARAAGEIAAAAVDPAVRAQVWSTMRGTGNTDLIPLLLNALRTDIAARVRVEAVATLSADFATDARVVAGLNAAATDDPRAMVRALARRGLSGDGSWNEYVVSSLKDTALPATERIEALLHTVSQSGRIPELRSLLADDEAIEAFAEVYSIVARTVPESELQSSVLLYRMGSLFHPAITKVLVEGLDRTRSPEQRRTIVTQLVQRNRDERARRALEMVSTQDADPELRQLAAKGLMPPAAP